ncbi:alanine--glyoxylate aminotransferase 2-like [Hermetia illucens]|uniref:alanine--glyoxylate aminotransferase 2-like n=1 Tax=Hermetia illucens TaxID=343691 RepID=UPI0018CC659F|nr:alanine--glyoxylate aminotransferase 2-like [Hermetia illucens]
MPFAETIDIKEQMSKVETIKLRNRHVGKSCQLFYKSDPLKIVRGQGQYMFDETGTRYLDCINNVAHVGHCHPRVVQAGAEQMATLSTNNRFLHDELVRCAQTLADKMPGNLSVCFLVNSGSEANDLALRLAKTHTKQKDVITLDHAYHGHLSSVMDISPYKFNQPGGEPKPDHVHVAAPPDVYRGKYNKFNTKGQDLGKLYAQEVTDIIQKLREQGKGVSAFIAESLQSCGGQIIPPDGYLQTVYDEVRKAGGVCIADEVQVGFGRVGSHYWAFDMLGVVPDIVTVAKPMGNGHPVGAVVTTPEIAESFAATGVSYFNTYGGNPVSCAIANAVMQVIEDEHLQENALKVGNYLLKECTDMIYEFDCVGDVRGSGLFLGIELVKGGDKRQPATEEAHWVVNRMKDVHKILVSSDGPNDNVIKLKPPMVFNIENAEEFLLGFRECLSLLQKQGSRANGVTQTSIICNLPSSKIHEKQDHLIKSV